MLAGLLTVAKEFGKLAGKSIELENLWHSTRTAR